MNLAPTTHTRRIARRIVRETEVIGADATLRHLCDVPPQQVPALVALLAKYAAGRTGLTAAGPVKLLDRVPPGMPNRFTVEQRRDAHRRYANGSRAPEVVAGEREYQRGWARDRRAARERAA